EPYGAPVGPQPQDAPGLVHERHLVDLAGQDEALDPLAAEATDHAAQAGDAAPVEAIDLVGERRVGLAADTDADDAPTQGAGFFGEQDRETAPAREQSDGFHGDFPSPGHGGLHKPEAPAKADTERWRITQA